MSKATERLKAQITNQNTRNILDYAIKFWQQECGIEDIDAFIQRIKSLKDQERYDAIDEEYGNLVVKIQGMKVRDRAPNGAPPKAARDASIMTKRNMAAGFRRLLLANGVDIPKSITTNWKISTGAAKHEKREDDLTFEDLRKILNDPGHGLKIKVLLRLFLSTGARRDEVRSLKWGDIDFSKKPITVYIRAEGAKFRKTRTAFTTTKTAEMLKELRAQYKSQGAPHGDDDYVFVSSRGTGGGVWRQMSGDGIYNDMMFLFQKANGNIKKEGDTRHKQYPHLCRAFAKTHMLHARIPRDFVDKIVGHKGYLDDEYLITEGRRYYKLYESYLEDNLEGKEWDLINLTYAELQGRLSDEELAALKKKMMAQGLFTGFTDGQINRTLQAVLFKRALMKTDKNLEDAVEAALTPKEEKHETDEESVREAAKGVIEGVKP